MATAPGLDERQHVEALKAVLLPVLNGHVYDYGKVPGESGNTGTLPKRYALLHVERAFIPSAHAVRRATRTNWRVTVRGVGQTANEARWVLLHATEALGDNRLTVATHESTPLAHEASESPTPDDGLFSGAVVFTYVL